MPQRKLVKAKPRVLLTAVTVMAFGLVTTHFVRAASQPQWIALQGNDWARVEIEPVLYETAGQTRYFNHFRVVNKTHRALVMDLDDAGIGWRNLAASDRTTLGEGDHRGTVSELIAFPLLGDIDLKERNLMKALKMGKASAVPADGALDYFIPAQIGTRRGVYQQYKQFPLWMKAKAYWPWAPMPPHLILVLRGAVSVSNGVKAKTFTIINREMGLPFPLKWKIMPPDARVMKNP